MQRKDASDDRLLEVVNAVAEHGSNTAAANALGMTRRMVAQYLDLAGQRGLCDDKDHGGFQLNGKRILAKKPNEMWRARFSGLEQGMGYYLDHLAEEWGTTTDTIRDKARRYGCLRYVETAPGHYESCAVHPDTPKGELA